MVGLPVLMISQSIQAREERALQREKEEKVLQRQKDKEVF
jgi:hypothetical protein